MALVLGVLLLFLLLGTARAGAGYDMFFQLAGIEQVAQVIAQYTKYRVILGHCGFVLAAA